MASGRKASAASARGSRQSRERSRIYQARVDLNAQQIRRRVRDNVVAGVVGGALVLGSIGAMTAYYVTGPGVETLTPSPTAPPTAPATPDVTTPAIPTPAPATTPAR